MKYISTKKLILIPITLISVFLSLSFSYYTQLINIQCGSDFHGIGEIFEYCPENITITALTEDGSLGSIISGEISSDGSINILPGVSSVKIVAEVNDDFSKTIQSKNNTSQSIERRSKIGGNGGKGGKQDNNKTTSYYIDANENLVFKDLNSSIAFYEIFDMTGTLIMDYNDVIITDNKIPLINLESAIYILKIQLDNGEKITEKILKQ